VRWWREGHLSSTGTCFDIGGTVREALSTFERTGGPDSGPTHDRSAGNGSIMRLAPVPLFFAADPAEAVRQAGESSKTTHGARQAVDACRYLGALLIGAVQGAEKDELLSARYSPAPGLWDAAPLTHAIDAIAAGSFKARNPPEIRGSGYVVHSLEAALWAFYHGSTFREGCLLAANLGEDADTTAAVYGQLAGAFYGEEGIPAEWRARLAQRALIEAYAEQLYALAGAERMPSPG
jgi:ADP-ribosylglycohydrolase